MNNIVNLIFFFSMYPFLFILYYIMKAEGKVKQHKLFGIRFSKEWLSDEECAELENRFRNKLNRYLLILALIPLVTFVIPSFSIGYSIWMMWLLATIVIILLPYNQGYRNLLQLKTERLNISSAEHCSYSEIKNAGIIRTIKWNTFLIPELISLALLVFALFRLHEDRFEMYALIIFVFAACTPLFHFGSLAMDKTKTKVISQNSDVNVNYARACKKIWKDFWNFSIWINTIFTAIILGVTLLSSFTDSGISYVILWGSILYCVLLIFYSLRVWKKKTALDTQYEDKTDLPDAEDEHGWIGGIVYYNPKDKHTMVSSRYGMGTTVNMATPVGKILAIIAIISLLIIPVSCIWVMLEEFTPISLSVQEETLIAKHWKSDYEIPTDTIEQLTLVEELPRSTKVNGTGMDQLEKGTFRIANEGKAEYFLNPTNGTFLHFTSNGTIYYMSGYNDAETLEIYELLTKQ